MSAQLSGLAANIGVAEQLLNEAANDGMEVSRAQYELREASNHLIDARVRTHGVSPEDVTKAVIPGLQVAKQAHQAGLAALAEFQFRRKGLAVSLLFIGIAVLALYLKLRQIERRQSGSQINDRT